MTRPFLPTRPRRLLATRAVAGGLVSLAGLAGRPARNPAGTEVGRVVDVVARWDGDAYPPVTGLVVRIGRRRVFVPAGEVAAIERTGVRLATSRLSLADFERRPGELALLADVVDHQMVDVDGVRVIRASDLYLARAGAGHRLVGVDVGLQSLLRRLGPARWRGRPTPDRVIDWAAIQPFGGPGALQLRHPHQELRRLRPAEVADLLEDLGRRERHALLGALGTEAAADALEEMDAAHRESLLRQTPAEEAARLVAEMEPDEGADALRGLGDDERARILAAMPDAAAEGLARLVAHPAGTAGTLMTTAVFSAAAGETVAGVRHRLAGQAGHREDVDAVLLVDDDGRLVDDISLFELFLSEPDTRLGDLAAPPWPVVVTPGTPFADVVERLIDNRRTSIVVVDAAGRPVGRILADDVVDALVPDRGRPPFPRIRP